MRREKSCETSDNKFFHHFYILSQFFFFGEPKKNLFLVGVA